MKRVLTTQSNFIYCTVIAFMLCVNSVAQPTVMSIPEKYFESPDGDLVEGRSKTSKYLWTVFSDRDDNKAYDTPSEGASSISIANFLDKFYATGEAGGFLELYKWTDDIGVKMSAPGGKVQLNPKKAVRVGWIKKEYLLLWSKCLENKITHFAEKAMAVVSAKTLDADFRKDNSLRIFSSPDIDKENKSTIKMFSFLYVYKSSGKRVLIGKISKTEIYHGDRDILGWVDTIFLQRWPDRVCLVPNSENEAVKSRKDAEIKASLFYDKEEVVGWKEGKTSKSDPCWDDDTYEKPWLPSRQRLPIFKTENEDIVYTGFTTDLYKEGPGPKKIVMTSIELDEAEQKLQELLKKARSINIVFVIDAGFGMANYASAITNSLRQLIRKKEEMNKAGAQRNTYKYGAVVYRSEADKVCPGGNLALNKYPLTSNASEVTKFLTNEFSNEGCSNDILNKNTGGALLEALNMIKDANKGEDIQSNYVFFIGGATGNKTVALDKVPELIARYDISLSVFQVQSITDPVEFERFPDHFTQILIAATEAKKRLTPQKDRKDILMKMIPGEQNLFKLDYPKTSPIVGNINFPDKGETIPASVIDKILDETMTDYENELENAIDKTKALVMGMTDKKTEGVEINAVVRNFLNRISESLKNYDLGRKFNGQNVQFFIPAWTSVNVKKLEKPVFKYVLYVNDEELTDMMDKFERLIPEAPPSDMRDMMYEAYESLAQAYFGKEILIDSKFADKITLEEILLKITGLPSSSQLFKDIKFSDIKDVRKVSDEKIEEIRKRINSSYDALKIAKNDLYGNIRYPTDDGTTYYWILQDYLP